MLQHPGKTIDFDGKKIVFPEIKLIYWAGGNPIGHQPQINAMLQALRRSQSVIVHEVFWTPTAKFADIVLPVTSSLERNDIASIGLFSNQGFVAMQKAIEPLFAARNDFDIFAELAGRLGFREAFTEGCDEMAWIRSFYDTARRAAVARKVQMPDFQTFWHRGLVIFPIGQAAQSYVTYAEFRKDPGANPLGTPSGRIEIYSTTIEKFRYADRPPHPTWLTPGEWLGSHEAARYPLALITPHPKHRLHSQLDNTPLQQRRWNKLGGRAPIWMHPTDAHARGLAAGDIVRVYNGRGQTLAGLVITDRIAPGVTRMEEGTWYDPQKGGTLGSLDKEGSPNNITLDKGTSSLAQGPIVNSTQVQVEKHAGPAPAVTAYSAPTRA